jgi:2-polyprenyl-3-methyl-5-hydroxy-6-metoxy-1,4-benzoquinol methylase
MNVHALIRIINWLFFTVEKIIIKFKKLVLLYITYYEDIVKEEISMVNIRNTDNILHMGCGSIPSTSILLAQNTGATITGIDKKLQAVDEARLCLRMLKLVDHKIIIKNAEALNYPIKNFDVILVSQGLEQRNEILSYISHSMKKDARIIFRTISSPEGSLNKQDYFLKNLFKIANQVSHKKHGLLISVMLLKE